MRPNGWVRKWRAEQSTQGRASALLCAAAQGDSLDRLLDLGVRALLEAGNGERAGLWLMENRDLTGERERTGERRRESSRGRVGEATPGPIPEQWKYLDLSTPLVRSTLESTELLNVEFGSGKRFPAAGPLVGMDSAIWMAIRSRNRILGVAMVARARSDENLNVDAVRARGDEIALAIGLHCDALRRELAAEELRAQSRLSRAILCGVSADSILPQVARAARQYVQSEFIALGGTGSPPVSVEGWAGPDEWRALLQQEPVMRLWHKAFQDGRESDLRGDAIPVPMASGLESSQPVLDRLIAIPIEVRNRTAGVLMAGLQQSEDGNDDYTRLESYALLAAFALDREAARQEQSAGKKSLRVYRDITDQRLIQSKLLQTEKMAALGQLVSGIAHELNNPLTSIQGYAQLLMSRDSASDRTGNIRRISQEAERAGRIVKNLLLFSRETKPERRAVNLNEMIERTLALRAYELKLENIAVELVLDPGLPNTLADSAQVQQVILNLIVNAEQAIVQGRGEESRHGRIHIRTRHLAGDRIGMEVSDDGPGISPEVVSRIFDPFFTTKPAGVGTGLGLSIVYGIVQEHGGEVSVESKPGLGATLTIEFPALSMAACAFSAQDMPASPEIAVEATLFETRAATRSERILVVEDEPTVAQLIADVMTEEGHRADTLLDSREALGRLETRHYGLVICDLKMPHLDGPGLYRALVNSGNPMRQKIVFVTGDTMSPRTLEFLTASGLPYLAKPFLVDELKEIVRQAFASRPDGEAVTVGKERLRAVAREI